MGWSIKNDVICQYSISILFYPNILVSLFSCILFHQKCEKRAHRHSKVLKNVTCSSSKKINFHIRFFSYSFSNNNSRVPIPREYSWQRIMWEVVEEKSGSGTIWTRKANSSSGEGGRCIPDICHFFYTGFPNPKFYTQKNTKTTPKHAKKSLKVLNICSFCVQSGKFYTWQNIFTRAPPVVPVTNIRYG